MLGPGRLWPVHWARIYVQISLPLQGRLRYCSNPGDLKERWLWCLCVLLCVGPCRGETPSQRGLQARQGRAGGRAALGPATPPPRPRPWGLCVLPSTHLCKAISPGARHRWVSPARGGAGVSADSGARFVLLLRGAAEGVARGASLRRWDTDRGFTRASGRNRPGAGEAGSRERRKFSAGACRWSPR